MANRRRLIIGAIILAIPCAAGLAYVTVLQWRHGQAVAQADAAFEAARGLPGADPEADAFMTRGVKAGMTLDEVDALMAGASVQSVRPSFPVAPGGLRSRLYQFVYGPPSTNPFTGRAETLMEETFFVYFDANGKATEVLHSRFGQGRWRMRNRTIVLR